MNIGDKVSHPQLGKGVITKLNAYRGDKRALVDFGYTEEFILIQHLTLVESQKPTVITTTEAPVEESVEIERPGVALDLEDMPLRTVEARKGIVALRLGQVLESHVSQLSVGTTNVENELRNSLDKAGNNQPTMVMVEGAWGGGKTHLLTLLSSIAREQNFAISNVVMDGVGVTLSDPMQLMESITSSLHFPSEKLPGGLASHLVHANIHNLKGRGAILLADALEQVPREILQEPEVLQVLEDYFGLTLSASQANAKLRLMEYRRIKLPSLGVRSVDDRAHRFCLLLRDWAQFTVTLGARGLVVVLDELDVDYAKFAWRDKTSAEMRRRRHMLIQALGELRRKKIPLLVAFASAPAGPDVGIENDAVKGVDMKIGGLDFHIQVPIPREKDIQTLGCNVMQLYMNAYPESESEISKEQQQKSLDVLVKLFHKEISPVPRHFVRFMLELLDARSAKAATS